MGVDRNLLDRPGGDLVVPFLRVVVVRRPNAPIHERMVAHRRIRNQLLGRSVAHAAGRTPDMELRLARRVSRLATHRVIDLAGAGRAVAMPCEVLRQRHGVLPLPEAAEPGRQPVDARRRGAQREHQARARGIAQRRLAMGIGEQGAARRQPIEVRRLGQRMSAQAAQPIVLIVDGDEQHVGARGSRKRRGGRQRHDHAHENRRRVHIRLKISNLRFQISDFRFQN